MPLLRLMKNDDDPAEAAFGPRKVERYGQTPLCSRDVRSLVDTRSNPSPTSRHSTPKSAARQDWGFSRDGTKGWPAAIASCLVASEL